MFGAEHIGADDTFDADYGRLLARVMELPKWGTSPAGFDTSGKCASRENSGPPNPALAA
jgi:hypothetical protein